MKPYKQILALASCAAAAMAAIAGVSTATNDDRVKLSMVPALPAKSAAPYPALLADGAADGVPYGLRLMDVSGKTVHLSWLSPEATNGFFDDFESHDDFAINSPGSIGWQYIDGDNAYTYTWQACSFSGMGQRMAFIVMNPSATTPAVDSYPNYQPYSGSKMLVDFCAVGTTNNDYIISPELSFGEDFKFSFRARSYTDSYGLERVRVGYSTTGTRQSDFTWVSEGSYVEVPAEWTLMEYTIPAQAKYVALNCVSSDAFMLLIDDIFVGTNNVRPGVMPKARATTDGARLVGFNVYRDGRQVNSAVVDQVRYTDTAPDYGTYTYTVTALYSDGSESDPSEALAVEVPDTRLLPFEDDFSTWTLDADSWTVTNHDGLSEHHWDIDYYATGLVDPCATYGYSAQQNYDQSLATKELHTTNPAGTYLRFNLKLENYRQYNTDYLDVELTTDGGATWQQLASYDNTGGSFDWRVCQLPLANHLGDSRLFSIRFRAHGTSASYIDYWYVDDVKVWVPQFTSATLHVATADGPLAQCPVRMTATHGAIIGGTTDDSGTLQFAQIEQGTYTIEIDAPGCNPYTGTWAIGQEANAFTATPSRPVLTISQSAVNADMATESQATHTVTMTNTGDGPLTWHIEAASTASGVSTERLWQDVSAFQASGDLQASIAFDGEHYYTSSFTELGYFWKYNRQGELVDHFRLPGLYMPIYDLTYDGQYFYASDGNNYLYQLDLDHRRIADTIVVASQPTMTIIHCSWDPDRQGFWVGGSSTLGMVNRQGTVMARVNYIDSSTSMSIQGSAYDNTTPGGPYLWLADGVRTSEMVDGVMLRQYRINTRSFTGVEHRTTDVPGYMIGNANYGTNAIGGIFSTFDVEDGKLKLIGILQQSPALIFSYTLCQMDSWLSINPKHGTLEAGRSQELTLGLNTLRAQLGDELSTTATIKGVPEIAQQQIAIGVNVNSQSATPRPTALNATAGTARVELSWQPGTPQSAAQQATGYNVYRNGAKINAEPIADTTYADTHLVYGQYAYAVTAIYPEGVESAPSDSVVALVKDGAQYYAPIGLEATLSHNRDVALAWQSPMAGLDADTTATWAQLTHGNQLGMSEGGYFYVASAWTPADLIPYRHRTIRSVGVMLVNPAQYLQLRIYKDGQLIYRKVHDGTMLYDGSLTTVTVDEPLTVEPGCEYYFAFQLMNSSGVYPVSLDAEAAVEGKGNLLSMDGTTWFPASYQGISGNFNIVANLGPATGHSEQAPTGYNVYRDGVKVNSQPVAATTWADQISDPGEHTYALSSVYADGGESPRGNAATVSVVDIGQRLAPTAMEGSVEANRTVSLVWGYPGDQGQGVQPSLTTRPVTTAAHMPQFVRTFEGTNMSTEMAIASDNEYIYTSIYADDGRICKYSLTGELMETFTIDGLEGVRNLAWDGHHFYATDNLTYIHRLDMQQHTIAESMQISEYGRHLAYIPQLDGGRGGFEVGDWETSIYVAMNGSKLADGPTLKGAAGTAYHNGLIYAFEQGGDNAITIGVYDWQTLERVDSIDVSAYAELAGATNYSAGGMSLIQRPDGVVMLAMAMQSLSSYSRFLFLELSSTTGTAGYNIYRDGQQLNQEPLERRYWTEDLSEEGTYQYQVQTVYIDGTSSPLSDATTITIAPKGTAPQPAHVQAAPSSYGYNVLVSFANPGMYSQASTYTDFESIASGQDIATLPLAEASTGWTATAERHYDGQQAMTALESDYALMVIPASGMTTMQLCAANADDHQGNGTITVHYSTGGSNLANFVPLHTITTTEQWAESTIALPEGTEYVALLKAANTPQQYVDALRLYGSEPEKTVYGYDVYRDGAKINASIIDGVSYIDRNLQPGTYQYQVSLTTMTAAVSQLSDPVTVVVDYDNGGQAPTNLRAQLANDGQSVALSWQAPALGEPIYLRWHDGTCHDAGGLSSGGAFFAGARWYATDLEPYQSLTLTNVEFYVNQVPEALYVLVYQGRNVIRQQYVASLQQYSFNNIKLSDPVAIEPGYDYIVAIYVEHNEITVPLGYDAGPAREGRGNLYSNDGVTWSLMSDDDTSIDANWNISIGLSPYANAAATTTTTAAMTRLTAAGTAATGSLKAVSRAEQATEGVNSLLGYNVYRNRTKLNDALLQDTAYVDTNLGNARYLEYQVAAVYSATGESMSDIVTITTTAIDGATVGDAMMVTHDGSAIAVSGAPAGATATLWAADGTLRHQATTTTNGTLTISTANMAPGTYILRIGSHTVKVAR